MHHALNSNVRRQRKNGYRLLFTLFLSDVNLGLFRFYSVTQRENLVLALKNAFSNSDWLTLVVSVSGYYLNTVNQPLPSSRLQHDATTPFQRNKI